MKLTVKLTLAFLLIILFSIGTIAVFTRFAANRDFNQFITDRFKAELADELAKYYQENQSWKGVERSLNRFTHKYFDEDNRPLFFSIADVDGKIIIAGVGYREGETVNADVLDAGTKIQVNDKTAGVLLLEASPVRNPMEDDFLHRINNSIFLSALGAILIAFILGAILSRAITNPIRELTNATREIANGKLDQRVTIHARDEIGELAESFNKMSADLTRSFNLRKQMTADIAHELRTPLSIIIGHAEAVHDGALPPSAENFEIIREEAERLEKMVNDLRELSLADAGELYMEFQPVEINQLLKDIHAHYAISFAQKRITLNVEYSPVPLQANLDPMRFAQVLTNVLDNALRYAPAENGQVLVKAEQIADEIQISIEDNGEGVTSEEAAHLFDRFYRADSARNRDAGGSGLGLAIAKSIVETHKGRVWAEGEKGHGLRVAVRLPLGEIATRNS